MDLKLSVLLGMIDKATAPLRSIAGSSSATSKALRETRQRLKELDKAQSDIQGFRDLKAGTRQLAGQLADAQQRASALGKSIAGVTNPTRAQTRAFAAAKRQAQQLGEQYQSNTRRLQAMRETLSTAGINTRTLSQHERRLRDDIAATNRQLDAQKGRLRGITEQQQRMAATRQAYERTAATGTHMAVGGYAAMATGRHLIDGIAPMIGEGKTYETLLARLRAQGTTNADTALAERFANTDTTQGSSVNDRLEILKDANSIFRDMHEAIAVAPELLKTKFTFEGLMASHGEGDGHGQGTINELIDAIRTGELRNATKTPEDFKHLLDMMTRAYVGSGGLVKPSDYLQTMKVGGVAAKQMDEKALFFGAMHTIQEMGGMRAGTGFASAYQNWAAGRSTQQTAEALGQLGLVNKDAVKYGKNGHITKMLPGALVNQSLYETNPFEYMMQEVIPRLNPEGKLTDDQVVSKINGLFSARKGGDLFAGMFMQRDNIRKQLAASEGFSSLAESYQATGQTAQGHEVDLAAQKRDLYLVLGRQVLPLYVTALGKLVGALKSVNTFAQSHPKLAKGLLVIAGSVGVLMTAAGGLMILMGGLIGQFALLRFAMRMGGMSAVSHLFPAIATGARAALLAVTGVSLPVLALVAAFVLAALVVRKYWQPISAWFAGVWEGIGKTAGPVLDAILTALAPLKPAWDAIAGAIGIVWGWLSKLVEPFQATSEQMDGARASGVSFGEVLGVVLGGVATVVTFVARMFVGLGEIIGNAAGWAVVHWEPVGAWFSALWTGIKSAAQSALDWIGEKLAGVRSVIDKLTDAWRQLKGDTSPAMGTSPIEWITYQDTERAAKVADAIGRTPLPGNAPAISGPRAIASPAPVATRAPQAQGVAGDTVHITIDARGHDPDAVRKQVKQAMAEHERDKQARKRSSYSDEG